MIILPLGIKFVDKDSVSDKAFCTNKRGAMTKILPNEPYKYVKRDKKGRIKKSKKNKKGSSYTTKRYARIKNLKTEYSRNQILHGDSPMVRGGYDYYVILHFSKEDPEIFISSEPKRMIDYVKYSSFSDINPKYLASHNAFIHHSYVEYTRPYVTGGKFIGDVTFLAGLWFKKGTDSWNNMEHVVRSVIECKIKDPEAKKAMIKCLKKPKLIIK